MSAAYPPPPENVWTKDKIIAGLDANDEWVRSAVLRVYRLQTAEEQQFHVAAKHNGVGFSKTDAEFMSNIAERIIHRGVLSEKQMGAARRAIKKYWRQLLKAAEDKGHRVDYHAHERAARQAKKQFEASLRPTKETYEQK
jgi:hypothetical protein